MNTNFNERMDPKVHRVEKLKRLKQYFLHHLVEDPQDGTCFDCMVLDAIEALENVFKDDGNIRGWKVLVSHDGTTSGRKAAC